MRDLFARWAAPAPKSQGVAGVQGVTAGLHPGLSAPSVRLAPVTRGPSQGVQGVAEAGKYAVSSHPCTPPDPGGVTAPSGAEPLKILDSGGPITPRTPVTPAESDLIAEFEERAAIVEFEGGLSREQADKEAARAVLAVQGFQREEEDRSAI